MYILLLLAI